MAITDGNRGQVQAMLMDDPALVNAPSQIFGPPLQLALQEGHLDIAELLLSHAANVNAAVAVAGEATSPGFTLLHWAVADERRVDAADFLLRNGADPNVQDDSRRWTPLHWAAHHGADPRMKEIAVLLLDHGADVNARNKQGRTAYSIAFADPGCREMAELLRQRGGTE
jgi:ankyrin repeat protein